MSCCETALEISSVRPRDSVTEASFSPASALLRSGASLQELLIEVRRFDLRQRLPGFDPGADVDVPTLNVAADAGVNRRA